MKRHVSKAGDIVGPIEAGSVFTFEFGPIVAKGFLLRPTAINVKLEFEFIEQDGELAMVCKQPEIVEVEPE